MIWLPAYTCTHNFQMYRQNSENALGGGGGAQGRTGQSGIWAVPGGPVPK